MRFGLTFLAGICGVVVGHETFHGEGKQIPLHEQDFVQDSPEELERKWSFEVSLSLSFISNKPSSLPAKTPYSYVVFYSKISRVFFSRLRSKREMVAPE